MEEIEMKSEAKALLEMIRDFAKTYGIEHISACIIKGNGWISSPTHGDIVQIGYDE